MPDYSVDQLFAKLQRADAAGDTEAAKVIADEIRRVQGQQPRADFSNVQSQAATVPAQQTPTIAQEVGRGLGLGARATMEGIGSTIGIASDPLAAIGDKIVGRPTFGTARQGFSGLADMLHLPTPQNAAERISGDVTGAIAGGGGVIGLGRGLAARAPGIGQAVGEFLAARPSTQLASLVGGAGASGATRENGGGQGAQTLAGLVGGLAPGAVNYAGASTLRGLLRGGEAGRLRMEQGIQDFNAVGANPSVGQATGNRRTQGLESLLSGAPTSAGVMTQRAEQQAASIGRGLQNRADQFYRNASAERAGRAVESGADVFAGNIKATRRALYWQADRLIPANTKLPLSRTWQTLDSLVSPVQGAEATTGALVNPQIAKLTKTVADDLAANGGSMPYEAVRTLRSRIGEELTDFSLSADRPTAQYKRLYAALSQDLEDAARKQGPAAEQAYKRANAYTRASANRLEDVQRVVDKNGGPEKVFSAVMSGTKDGGTTLHAVMQSLPKDGQKAVTAAVIKRLGLATAGNQGAAGDTFSAQTFLTNWNNVSPEARRVLFGRHGPGFSANMDKIARVAERISNGSKVFANPSGSGKLGGALVYSGSLATALLSGQLGTLAIGIGAGAGANGLARAMTNPQFVKWLARATELPVSALPQQAVILKQVADREGDPDLAEIADSLQNPKQASQQ